MNTITSEYDAWLARWVPGIVREGAKVNEKNTRKMGRLVVVIVAARFIRFTINFNCNKTNIEQSYLARFRRLASHKEVFKVHVRDNVYIQHWIGNFDQFKLLNFSRQIPARVCARHKSRMLLHRDNSCCVEGFSFVHRKSTCAIRRPNVGIRWEYLDSKSKIGNIVCTNIAIYYQSIGSL